MPTSQGRAQPQQDDDVQVHVDEQLGTKRDHQENAEQRVSQHVNAQRHGAQSWLAHVATIAGW